MIEPDVASPESLSPIQRVQDFFKYSGPGIVTGAADDDPSGIATYTIAGARFGHSFLWLAPLTWPLMAVVQMSCARLAMMTGQGLAAALAKKFPRPVLILMCGGLFVANTINVGADLVAMADCAEMLSGWPSRLFVILFGVFITYATVRLRYSQIASVLKWLAISLFAYVVAALIERPSFVEVLHATLIPSIPHSKEGWQMLVAILGTTISPYLFFWQASQEVEEKKAAGATSIRSRRGASAKQLHERRLDVGLGTLFSNLIMFFIILSASLTLNRAGVLNIESAREAAEALVPIAGRYSAWLYTIGLIGVGLLAIPTLTGSAAYAFAETFRWKQGLDVEMHKAKAFYLVIIASSLFGILFDFLEYSPMKALYLSAVINGLLAPFLLFGILAVVRDKKLMNGSPTPITRQLILVFTMVLMFTAAIMMFWT